MTRQQAIEIIKKVRVCTECNNEITDCMKCEEAILMAIAALEEQEHNKWIPVSDHYPTEEDKQYICCDDSGSIHLCGFSKDLYRLDCYDFIQYKGEAVVGFYDYDSEWGHRHCDEVVAWLERPKPYETK